MSSRPSLESSAGNSLRPAPSSSGQTRSSISSTKPAASSEWNSETLPHRMMSLPSSAFSARTASRSRTTVAGSCDPHSAFSMVVETTTLRSAFSNGAIGCSRVGQTPTNNRYVSAPSSIVSIRSKVARSSASCSPTVPKNEVSPSASAAYPSRVTYSWKMSCLILGRLAEVFAFTAGYGQQDQPGQHQQNNHGNNERQHFSPRFPTQIPSVYGVDVLRLVKVSRRPW